MTGTRRPVAVVILTWNALEWTKRCLAALKSRTDHPAWRVIVVDNLFLDDDAEEADRVRDPSHVKNWSEGEWRGFFASAGLHVEEVRRLEKPIEVEPWLERAGTGPAPAPVPS